MHKLKPNYIKNNRNSRLYGIELPIIALTGGISSGKSTCVKILKEASVPVLDADSLIKTIYAQEKTKDFIQCISPESITKGTINFKKLRSVFFENALIKNQIEKFLYQELPHVFKSHLASTNMGAFEYIIYDIPLLFEKKMQGKFDLNVLVYAPQLLQLERLLKRDKIPVDLAQKILKQQLDIEKKRDLAQFIICNDSNEKSLYLRVDDFLRKITCS